MRGHVKWNHDRCMQVINLRVMHFLIITFFLYVMLCTYLENLDCVFEIGISVLGKHKLYSSNDEW